MTNPKITYTGRCDSVTVALRNEQIKLKRGVPKECSPSLAKRLEGIKYYTIKWDNKKKGKVKDNGSD